MLIGVSATDSTNGKGVHSIQSPIENIRFSKND